MAHKKIINSVKKQGQVTIKDLDEFLLHHRVTPALSKRWIAI